MFTERAKLLLIIFSISLLLAWITQFELIYFICAILASILLISFLIFKSTLIRVNCSRYLPKAVYEDEVINVEVILENKGLLPNYFIYLMDNFSADKEGNQEKRILIPFLASRKSINWEYKGLCYKRGEYWIGPFTLVGSDPLGLFKKFKLLNITSKLTIYPRIFDIHELPSFIKGMVTPRYGSQTIRRSGDYEEFYGIREYRQEDGLRKIHWPSSAKHNELMARHFEQSGSQQVTIALDLNLESNLGKGKNTTLEYAIKIAASLSKYFLDRRAVVQIFGKSDKPVITLPARDPSHFFSILDTLAPLEANGYYPLDEALLELNPLIPPNSTLIVIALDTNQEILQSIEHFIYSKNVSIIYVLLISSTFNKDLPAAPIYFPQARGQDIRMYHIRCGESLQASFSSEIA
jgi:uncharacterized protein (DUF58 family)